MNDWRRLADLVISRRVELGMRTQQALADKTGLTRRLLSDIEHAKRDNYDAATIARLEQALGWLPGSVQAILNGFPPILPGEVTTVSPTERVGIEWHVMGLVMRSGLPHRDAQRILVAAQLLRVRQNNELVDEVMQMIAEAGGTIDDEPERLPPRPRSVEQSGDDAPHLYLDRDVSQPGLGGNARVPHGDLPQ